MANEDRSATGPPDVPGVLTERLTELDERQLRQTAEYIEGLLASQRTVPAQIEANEGEEIVSVTEHDGYTAVVKRQSCADGCADCPHGPYLYHVQRERGLTSDEDLHWSYIGPVK